MAENQEEPKTIAEDVVVTKYKMAAEIVNKVLGELIGKCVPGASVTDICAFGDDRLSEETSKVYRKDKVMKKGIAFPTCVCLNDTVCHFSPLRSEAPKLISEGDLVKLDLGAHIDGFPAVVAHSFVVNATAENKAAGKKANAVLAAYYAAEAAMRKLKPGNENYAVTEVIQKAAEQFQCKPIEGMLSHQLIQHKIDGEKAIISNPTDAQRKEHPKCEFDIHEVFALDILVSAGEGKAKEKDSKTTVYKKADIIYPLKMKHSRVFLSEVEKKYFNMPFSLRSFEDEARARMGVVECATHMVVEPFPVLWDKDREFVAQFKYTVLLMPNGLMKITGTPLDLNAYESEHSIQDEELKTLIHQSLSTKSSKKKNKKKTASAQAEVAAAAGEAEK